MMETLVEEFDDLFLTFYNTKLVVSMSRSCFGRSFKIIHFSCKLIEEFGVGTYPWRLVSVDPNLCEGFHHISHFSGRHDLCCREGGGYFRDLKFIIICEFCNKEEVILHGIIEVNYQPLERYFLSCGVF